jgi:hypothetical protein
LKQSPTALLILLYVLWRRGVETKHEDGKWHFHVGDIAKHLGKDEKTIRKHLKPLLDLGTLNLVGEIGERYYVFNEEKYGEYLALDPNTLNGDTPPANRHPSPKMEGAPLPENGRRPLPTIGRVKTAEEKIAEQSCPVQQDWTAASLGLEGRSSLFKEAVASISASSGSCFPVVTRSCASSAASGFSGTEESKQFVEQLAALVVGAPSMGGFDQSGSAETTKTGSAAVAPDCALRRNNGQSGNSGSTQGMIGKLGQSRPVFVASHAIAPLPLPSHVSPAVSAKRQDAIVKSLNDGGCHFVKNGAIDSNFCGYTVCAYDAIGKAVLVTADDCFFAQRPHIQELCARFIPQDWMIVLWTADDQSLHLICSATGAAQLETTQQPNADE